MFDSVLVLDRPHATRLARAELATAVLGAHALAIVALIAAQAWRIDAVTVPSLPAPAFESPLAVVFDDSPTPARRKPPRAPAAPPAPRTEAPAAPTPLPEQLASAPVPTSPPETSVPPGYGETAATSPGAGGVGAGSTVGAGEESVGPIVWNPGLVRPTILVRVEPKYPRLAQFQRKDGLVVLQAEIATDGLVRGARVVQVSPEGYGFEAAALDAVRQWRFRPATTSAGQPVAVLYQLQVRFTVR